MGLNCAVCGERVNVSNRDTQVKGGGYWRVDPETQDVTAWHLRCLLESVA